MKRRRTLGVSLILALLAGGLSVVTGPAPAANAADGSAFEAGNIISDALFFDGAAMSASQVQSFLNSQVSSCSSGFTCLKDYTQSTSNRAGEDYRCSAYAGGGVESAATIIAKVGVACGISQKVLLVLLQKEQSLVTSTGPTSGQYRSATGYGCPDTAACDAAYYGFFNQVWMAALQFKRYAANPTGWNHIAGRENHIRYSPNAACGSSPVFIQNQATAGLYNYTPYQPNAAALNNLYGTGDGCSAYGNRNFWRLYTDWFGSTTAGSSLVRSHTNATVYLTSGESKYPIASLSILSALAPLGNVAFVSQSYLDRFQTRHLVGRVLRAPNGAIYFYDAGIKLPFTSCDQVVDYGGSCAADGYVQLTDVQLASFANGPNMGPVLGTTAGARYYINDGTKREILDEASQVAAGIPIALNVLTENAVSALPFAAPAIRDDAFALQRGSSSYAFLRSGNRHLVDDAIKADAGLPTKTAGSLWPESLAMLGNGSAFTGIVRLPGGTANQILTAGNRVTWSSGIPGGDAAYVTVGQSFVDGYPLAGSITAGSTVKTPASGTVYVVMASDLRPIGSWEALVALAGGGVPVITTLPDRLVAPLPKGPVALETATLARSPENATVFLINGVTDKIAFSSFAFPFAAGLTSFSYTTLERLDAYPTSSQLLGYGLQCGTTKYVSADGAVHAVSPELEALYPISYVPLDTYTCALLEVGAPAVDFIRTPEGSIYQLAGGQKRPIASMQRFAELNGGRGWLQVDAGLAAQFPTGPLA